MQDADQIRKEEAWGLYVVYCFRGKIMNCTPVYSIRAILLVPRTALGMQWALETCSKMNK